MTTRQTAAIRQPVAKQFPERLPRQEMQNSVYLDLPGYQTGLYLHFGGGDTTLVISEAALGWNLSQRRGIFYPDLMIAFNVDREAAIAAQWIAIDDLTHSDERAGRIAAQAEAADAQARIRELEEELNRRSQQSSGNSS